MNRSQVLAVTRRKEAKVMHFNEALGHHTAWRSKTIVNCPRKNDEVLANFIALLSANGFVETSRMEFQPGSPVSVTLEKDNLEVHLMIATTEDLSIMVVQKP